MIDFQFEKLSFLKSFRFFLIVILLLLCSIEIVNAQKLSIEKTQFGYTVSCKVNDIELLQAPSEGLWSIATGWKNDWCTTWSHANPSSYRESGSWQILEGKMTLPQGEWLLRDSYRTGGGKNSLHPSF